MVPAEERSPSVPAYAERLAWLEAQEAETPPEQRGRRLAARGWAGLWPKVLAIAMVLAIWQLIHVSGWKKLIFPAPGATLADLWDQLHTGLLWRAIGITSARAVIGFAIILFGISTTTILFVIVLGAAPSIANGLIAGVDYTPPLLLRAGKMMGLRRLSLYRYLILPASLPAFVAGLRQGWAFAWRSLMAGELLVTIAGQPSLGVLLSTDQAQADMESATAIIIVILILRIIVHTLFGMADKAIRRRWGLTGNI